MANLLYAIEMAPATVHEYREKSMLLERLRLSRYLYATPAPLRTATFQFLLGLFHVNFALLWPDVQEVLGLWGETHPSELWTALQAKTRATCEAASAVTAALRHNMLTKLAVNRHASSAEELKALATGLEALPSTGALTEAHFDDLLRARLRPTEAEVAALNVAAGETSVLFGRILEATAERAVDRIDSSKVHTLLMQLSTKLPKLSEQHNR